MGVKLTCLLSFVLQGLDNVSSATLRPFNSDINTPRIDSYRFSMANLEGKFARTGFIDPVFHPEKSPDLSAISTRARLEMRPQECVGTKSRFERRVSATRESSRLPDDSSPIFRRFFPLYARFSSPRQVNMTALRGNGSYADNRSPAPFAISSPWILTRSSFIRSFLVDFAKAGSGRLPRCVNFSGASCAALSRAGFAPTRH